MAVKLEGGDRSGTSEGQLAGGGVASGIDARRDGAELFDGAGKSQPAAVQAAPRAAGHPLVRRFILSPLGRLLPARLFSASSRASPVKGVDTRALSKDQHGGPELLTVEAPAGQGRFRRFLASQWAQARYGLKWAVNLMGISALLGLVVRPALAGIPWQLFVSEPLLERLGRVLLLTSMGPAAIAQAVAQAPFGFLLLGLPSMALAEEITFRVLQFGLAFLGLAVLKPIADRLDGVLKDLPDVFGLRTAAQWGLLVARAVSSRAYPLAAAFSAFGFALAHIGAWGFSPFTFLSQFVLGLVLAHVAYRSRGLTAPFVSHLAFNLATITLAFALPLYIAEGAAAIVAALAAVLSVGGLWYNYRVYRKAKAAAVAEALEEQAPAARKGLWRRLLTGLLIIPMLLGAFGLSYLRSGPAVYSPTGTVTVQQPVQPGEPQGVQDLVRQLMQGQPAPAQQGARLTVEQIIRQSKPAVVMVRMSDGSGTGFIVDPSGLLVTNAHVVAADDETMRYDRAYAEKVTVMFADGRMVPALVVGFNPDKDLALIQLPPNPAGWPTVALGDSARLVEGEEVVALGYPLGQPFTATRGIVSGLGSRGNGYVQHIQTDAAINPGNSGGPLFNAQGQVVGVNTLIESIGGGSDGIGLSITSQDVRAALEQYRQSGDILSASVGAIFHPANPEAPAYGAWVEVVRPGSAADTAGLRAGDTVVEVEGQKLANDPQQAVSQLGSVVRAKKPGETLKLTVSGRDGQVRAVELKLDGR